MHGTILVYYIICIGPFLRFVTNVMEYKYIYICVCDGTKSKHIPTKYYQIGVLILINPIIGSKTSPENNLPTSLLAVANHFLTLLQQVLPIDPHFYWGQEPFVSLKFQLWD